MRRALFAVAAIGGLMALVADVGRVLNPSAAAQQPPSAADGLRTRPTSITAPQLAQWIRDGKPGLRILDGRGQAAYDWYHIPGAEHTSSGTIVVIADGRELELRGGMQAWLEMLQRPGALSRYFGGPPRRGGC